MPIFTLASFAFFTGLVGLLTYVLTRKDDHGTSTGYFLAGRTLTGGYIAGSLMLTNLSTEQLVGLNGAAFTDGICVMAWEVIAAMSLVVMALLFLPRYLQRGIATVPQFLEERFDPGTRTITTFIFIFAYAGILLPIILYTGATGMMGILNLREGVLGIEADTVRLMGATVKTDTLVLWGTVWLIGIIGSIYAIFGGLRTVAVSDTLNGFGLIVGGILITVLGLQAISGGGLVEGWTELREAHPEKFNSLGTANQSVPFSTLFTGVLLLNLFYWTTNQQIIQRTFGASSLAEGQKGVLYAGGLKVLTPIILVIPGIIAFHLYQRDKIPADHAYGILVQNVLPWWLNGFFAAVVAGAILSSFNSALNSTATLYSLGVYQHLIKPGASEEQVIRSGKAFGWVIALISMTVAPLLVGQKSIFEYLQQMNGLYFIPIFSVVLVGLFTRRVPALGAKVALVLGFAAIALGYFVPWLEEYVKALNEFHFLGIVFASLIALMLIVGLVAPRREPWSSPRPAPIDLTPWKWAWPAGLALVGVVLFLYVYFADFSVLYR